MIQTRRQLIGSLALLVAAPAIVKATSLMAVRPQWQAEQYITHLLGQLRPYEIRWHEGEHMVSVRWLPEGGLHRMALDWKAVRV